MSTNGNDSPDWMTPKEAAAFFRVHEDTVRRWIRNKSLSAERLPGGKLSDYRIARSDVEGFRRADG